MSFAALLMLLTAQEPTLPLIPRPTSIQRGPGSFTITASTLITTDRATRDLGHELSDYLGPATGFRLSVQPLTAQAASRITLQLDTSLSRLGPEGYRLEVSPTR